MLIHAEAHAKFLSISEDKRWWLGGFFDGDACVSAVLDDRTGNVTGITIVIGHSVLTKNTLFHVHEQLGGSAPRFARAAEGNRREVWVWSIDGKYAAQVARDISSYTRLKTPQYALAGEFFELKDQPARMKTYVRLRQLKHVEHEPFASQPPLAFFAGIYDAEGSVNIDKRGSVTAKIEQRYPAVLNAAKARFACGPDSVSKPSYEGGTGKWQVSSRNCLAFLSAIRPFLVERCRMVDIVLTLDKKKVPEARAELATLVGNKGKRTPQEARARKRQSGEDLPVNISEIWDGDNLTGYYYKSAKFEDRGRTKKGATSEDLAKFLADVIAYSKKPDPYVPKEKLLDLPRGITSRYDPFTGDLTAYTIQSRSTYFPFAKELNIKYFSREDAIALRDEIMPIAAKARADKVKHSEHECAMVLDAALRKVTGKGAAEQPNMKYVQHFMASSSS